MVARHWSSSLVSCGECPEQLAWGLAFHEATERVSEVQVVSRELLLQLEKIQEVLPSRRDVAHIR